MNAPYIIVNVNTFFMNVKIILKLRDKSPLFCLASIRKQNPRAEEAS